MGIPMEHTHINTELPSRAYQLAEDRTQFVLTEETHHRGTPTRGTPTLWFTRSQSQQGRYSTRERYRHTEETHGGTPTLFGSQRPAHGHASDVNLTATDLSIQYDFAGSGPVKMVGTHLLTRNKYTP